ncbi:putative rRNA maturation factor [Catalinimonas alkaloidigena]|uniref:rRNA maturation RNase YbeY n=1 Tax=Catalinimonas alkaloidigena TaxID=1075417 RepID=UPI002406AD99|nr:rRNA maturation RNase YbeY [Catalinimonas alkaloidigena]MDF9800568.1 putative rRNA maturation factor [Catalinimonas alkaloidigena]
MIHFFTEEVDFNHSILSPAIPWIEKAILNEGYTLENLNYIFCSDAYLLQINILYLQHDYFTDIITFDNSEFSLSLDGDIFISIERVDDNSQSEQTTFFHELLRVIIHGALHLMGYDDKDTFSKSTMRKMEDKYLDLYFQDFHIDK